MKAYWSGIKGRGTRNDIGAVIRELVNEWRRHPYDINNGECQEFAEAMLDKMNSRAELWESTFEGPYGTHFFVRYDGRFYDAESPDGDSDWHFIPFFRRR